VLINSVLTSLTMFMLSFFEVPKGVLEKIDYYRSRFFWQNDSQKKKYRLAKWDMICQPREQDSLVIQNIEVQNKCLLSKWLFKLINEDGLWHEILRKKYLTNQTIGKVKKKPGDSQFWTGLMNVKPDFLRYRSFQIKNVRQICFWEDKWLCNYNFQQQYPTLHNIARRKSGTIAHVLSAIPLNVSFRRYLAGNNLILWNNLVMRVALVQLVDSKDVFGWNLHQHGQFTVYSMYLALNNNGSVDTNRKLWKVQILLKIKISM
jgi:hypothetical protein